jgi:hypothetical protein
MGDPFARLTGSVLARLGKDAVLRGEVVDPPIKVNIEHGVQLVNSEGAVFERSVATLPKASAPASDDTLSHPDGEYILDTLHADNGHSVRFIIRKAT